MSVWVLGKLSAYVLWFRKTPFVLTNALETYDLKRLNQNVNEL